MNIIILCKMCKNDTFEESWDNGPLICMNCGAVDDVDYISEVTDIKINQDLQSILNISKDVENNNKDE